MANQPDERIQAALTLLQACAGGMSPEQQRALLGLVHMAQQQKSSAEILAAAAAITGMPIENLDSLLQDPAETQRLLGSALAGAGPDAAKVQEMLRSAGITRPGS